MKTTVELPDDLMVEVKITAARRRLSIRKFVEGALRREVVAESPNRSNRNPFHWPTIPGGFAPGLDVSDREAMYQWLDRHRDRD